ncbi:casein kinase ii subunit beta [Anaeramoeba flamelloides]|uniref:Casein kinase II subunit beta n=1 Tax=Anaeramoeba flamelloides TaxID=1746091 RepID=A0AAV7ZKU2_9EUKA|nr:casein kinase ii subunit beta [Anaeramoeba flamelloides]
MSKSSDQKETQNIEALKKSRGQLSVGVQKEEQSTTYPIMPSTQSSYSTYSGPSTFSSSSGIENEDYSSNSGSDPKFDENTESYSEYFCSLKYNEFFCHTDHSFLIDNFNFHGISEYFKYYEKAVEIIRDQDSQKEENFTKKQYKAIDKEVEFLYGILHARFIVTQRGLEAMREKYLNKEFGVCPRTFCNSFPVLPIGFSDTPSQSKMKIFCPQCKKVYYPPHDYNDIDSAFFGSTFPNLFINTFPELIKNIQKKDYKPKMFGFDIHPSFNWYYKLNLQELEKNEKTLNENK